MTVKRPTAKADAAIESIRLSLRTDVVDVLRNEISTLRTLPRNTAYETIMNQPTVLDACFRLMREKPQLFKQLATDAGPASDEAMLHCGRTMGEVITLVVRAAARRYFRARLGQHRRKAVAPKAGLMRRIAQALNLQPANGTKRTAVPETPADRLYNAMREYLQFDWQALLIPHYTPMTPQLVNKLGARLLDIREPAELKALAGANDSGDGRPPLLLDTARRMIPAGGDIIDPEILWNVCQQMDLGRLYPNRDAAAIRRAVAQVAATDEACIALMLPVLGADIRRFTAFLMVAHSSMGEQRFRQVLGRGGQLWVVRRWMERLAALPVPAPRLDEMKRVYQEIFEAGAAEPSAAPAAASVDRERARAEVREAMQRLPGRTAKPKMPV